MKTSLFAFCAVLIWMASCKAPQDIKKSNFYISGSPPVMVEVIQDPSKPMNMDPIMYSDFLSLAFVDALNKKKLTAKPLQYGQPNVELAEGDITINIFMARIEELIPGANAGIEGAIPESSGYKITIDYSFAGMGKKGTGSTKTYHSEHTMTKEEQRKVAIKSPDADLSRVLIQKAADEVVKKLEVEVQEYLDNNLK